MSKARKQYRRDLMEVKRQTRRDVLVPSGSAVVGIDLSRDDMRCAAMQLGRKEPFAQWQRSRDRDGVDHMAREAKQLCEQHVGHTDIVFAMEPTGGYWIPVAQRLHQLRERYVLVSSRNVAKTRVLDDGRRQSNDPKDARRIAGLTLDRHILFLQLHELTQDRVNWQGWACEYYDLTEALTAERNRIHAWLQIVRPEFRQAVSDLTKPTALAILQVLPRIKPQWQEADFVEAVKTAYPARRVAMSMLRRLWPLVQHPAAWGSELHGPSLDWRVAQAGARAALLQEQLTEAERRLMQAYDASDEAKLLDTIPANPRKATASVLGLTGDLNRFDSPRAVVKFAGNDPVQDQSGQHRGQCSVSGLGQSRLRGAAYRAAEWLSGRGQNPWFRTRRHTLCQRAVNPLHYRAAVVACSNTYLRMIAVMVHKGLTYDEYRRFAPVSPPEQPFESTLGEHVLSKRSASHTIPDSPCRAPSPAARSRTG